MKRIRFGIKIRLPFGLFKNAGIFVIRTSADNAQRLERAWLDFSGILYLVAPEVYSDLVFEVE